MLVRIRFEYDKYVGAPEFYETKTYYIYTFSHRVGKILIKELNRKEEYNIVTEVVKLCFSLKGFWICLKNTYSSFYNLITT